MYKLSMAGLDAHVAHAQAREPFAFSDAKVAEILAKLQQTEGVLGAVLLVTCNRTELYLSCENVCTVHPKEVLTRSASASAPLYVYEDQDAVMHLMEVACGMHSQMIHEEQIVSQVGQALEFARQCHSTDAVLETLFQTAVSAGKASQTEVKVETLPPSIAHAAIARLEQSLHGLQQKKIVIIGNGKTGRLAAEIARDAGACVYMTLRVHPHKETVLPYGVIPVAYDQRFSAIDGADAVISATRSPHFTLTQAQVQSLSQPPAWFVDLAMPRDLEPSIGEMPGITVLDLDTFGVESSTCAPDILEQLSQVVKRYAESFHQWSNYRNALPYIQEMKQIVADRIYQSTDLDTYRDNADLPELVDLISQKSVDMVLGGMKSEITPALLQECCDKLRRGERTRHV